MHPSLHRELARQRQQDLLRAAAHDRPFHLRQLRAADRPALIDAFSRLSRQSRYWRYAAAKAELTHADLDRLTDVDPPRSDAVGAFLGRELIGVAEYAVGDEPRGPELGILVVDDWQRRGVGDALAGLIVRRARALRHPKLHAHVLADNRPALRFMRRLGFTPAARDGTFVVHELELVVPSVSSFVNGRRKPSRTRTQGGCVPVGTWPTEDAVMRRFAAVQAHNGTCGRGH